VTDRLLDAKDVAELLSVPVSWVREATRAGQLPVVRLGRYCRYDRADVEEWVTAQKRGGADRQARKHQPQVEA
jgi:excisionase family DNA binding protein